MIHALHGIHTASGSTVMPALFAYLPQKVQYPDYGFILAIETRRINPAIAGALLPYIGPEDILIGHSNGCAVIYELLQSGLNPRGVVFINGALRTDFILPTKCQFAHVYFNAGDDITILAMAGAEEGLVDPCWGQLGHSGYSGSDHRVINVDCGNTQKMPVVSGHSEIFCPGKIEAWGPFIGDLIIDACAADELNLRICVDA